MGQKRYEITDEQWDQIKEMIPRAKTGRPPKDNRLMFNAILWIAHSGASWADLPERYGTIRIEQSQFIRRIYNESNTC